jgi:PAS domain S-box-containing protein
MTSKPAQSDLYAVIGALHDAVLVFSVEGALVYANGAALTLHEVGDASLLGHDAETYARRFPVYVKDVAQPPEKHPAVRAGRGEHLAGETLQLGPAGEGAQWVLEARSLTLSEGGCALIFNDVTDEAEAEKRFERTFAANPAPAVISRYRDLRFIKVNQGFLEMTGYRQEEVLGRSVYDLDLLAGVKDRDLALKRFREQQTVPQMEARLQTKGGDKLVIVAGQPLEVMGEPCMLFSFIDLERWEKAQLALRHSEERFAKAFKLAPVAATLSVGGVLIDVNTAFEKLTEYHAAEVLGKPLRALRLWEEPPEGACRQLERKLRTKSGGVLDTLVFAEPITLEGKEGLLSMFHDITLRKQTEAELLAAIDAVMQDASWFGRSVVERLLQARRGVTESAGATLSDLTTRERQVLELISEGQKNEEIALALGLSKNTVRNYVANLYAKIGVQGRAEAVIWARERGVTGATKAPLLTLPNTLSR